MNQTGKKIYEDKKLECLFVNGIKSIKELVVI